METVFSVGSAERLYKRIADQLREELRESLETAVGRLLRKGGNELIVLQECGCEKKTSCVLQLQ
jgi:hypothetical protein